TGTTLTGPLTLFTNTEMAFNGNTNVRGWVGTESAGVNYPLVAKNFAATGQVVGGGFVPLNPGQLFTHPAPSGAYSVSRFTTPSAELYSLDVLFQGRDTRGTTTDVHILLNGLFHFRRHRKRVRYHQQPILQHATSARGRRYARLRRWLRPQHDLFPG